MSIAARTLKHCARAPTESQPAWPGQNAIGQWWVLRARRYRWEAFELNPRAMLDPKVFAATSTTKAQARRMAYSDMV